MFYIGYYIYTNLQEQEKCVIFAILCAVKCSVTQKETIDRNNQNYVKVFKLFSYVVNIFKHFSSTRDKLSIRNLSYEFFHLWYNKYCLKIKLVSNEAVRVSLIKNYLIILLLPCKWLQVAVYHFNIKKSYCQVGLKVPIL